jgi:nicotinamide mononucleotide (NMN) deamidase PncC
VHHLRMSKNDLVEAAVEFYLNARREEMQAVMRELLSQLDGSHSSAPNPAMAAAVDRVAAGATLTLAFEGASGSAGRTESAFASRSQTWPHRHHDRLAA